MGRCSPIAVARHAGGADSRVMGPHGAVVIGHGVVAGFVTGEGSYSPAAVKGTGQKLLTDPGRPLRPRQAGKEQLTGVGSTDPAQLALAIQCKAVEALVLHPESFFHRVTHLLGLIQPVLALFVITAP